ncbi:tRNA 4-thiouridine(8) synthase ThiI [Acholeplasma vituli]|uniref:Probable tRNA sulfurtransferase n=1 Tax=Paracholeplasma vituli TaxID=69473 RepID=A0ABT2PWV9_9MOLU|nr:tRNA uracil 4-sulfurtransferase ThiI [Paracholeplasma vituli]MCU0105448.1 tRNA 4-thiouridine(8) synthase ThiI [Paracholeplasma vituli]
MSMYDKVLIRFGDLMLKGKNQKIFRERAIALLKQNTKHLNVNLEKRHDRLFLVINDTKLEDIEQALMRVTGIGSFSFFMSSLPGYEAVVENAIKLIRAEVLTHKRFKIETKRVDKSLKETSQEITQILSKSILKEIHDLVTVDVKNPEVTLHVEIHENEALLYLDSKKGLGGFPVGVAGRGLLLLSGGIDSPVAGFLAMKQGVEVEGIHFESTPMTSIESAQKVIDLAKKMSVYAYRQELRIHMVPFFKLHQEIIARISPSYVITVMRRMFFRVAEKVAQKNHALAIITGESVGQVASQTLDSMHTIEAVTTIPVLRPLITYDKQDIIKISKQIDTYDISIQPFEDCCTIYTPTGSSTKPNIKKALINEKFMVDYDKIIDEIVSQTKTFVITPETNIRLEEFGFTVTEAWEAMHDHIERQ